MKIPSKKKYLAIPALAALGLFAGGTALAQGGPGFLWKTDPATAATQWEQKLSEEADILGMSVDEMKTNWAAGKGVREIAKEKGISDEDLQKKFQAAREQHMKEMLQTLVSQGKITQTQADARLKFMQENQGKHQGMMKQMKARKGGMGMMHGSMHGPRGMMQQPGQQPQDPQS